MTLGYHALAGFENGQRADYYARAYAKATSGRGQLRRKIERARAAERWHLERAASGTAVPPDVARHASLARHWLTVARNARREIDFVESMIRFRAAMSAAGLALRDHLAVGTNNNASESAGIVRQQ